MGATLSARCPCCSRDDKDRSIDAFMRVSAK